MVKRSLAQSHEAPSRRSWRVIVPPLSAFQSQTFSMKASRGEVRALLAPGVHLTLDDHLGGDAGVIGTDHPQRILALQVARDGRGYPAASTSSAWPMWSEPVTLGGGITMVNGFAHQRAICGWKRPPSSQCAYQRDSISAGSKVLGSSVMAARVAGARGKCLAGCMFPGESRGPSPTPVAGVAFQ